jgi:hypothetical protein
MKRVIMLGTALSVLILPEFCSNKPNVAAESLTVSKVQYGVSFKKEAWIGQRNAFLAAIGSHVDDIDQAVQMMESNEVVGPVEKRRMAYRNIQETRFLLEGIRDRLSYQEALNNKAWDREKLDLIASMNNLKSKYKLIKDIYHQ